MRALLQRVQHARITIEGEPGGSIGPGYVILLGVGQKDSEEEARKLWNKIWKLRIFDDGDGKANLSLADTGGDVLIVSQFTLYANCQRGNRPSFTDAAPPSIAEPLYERFVELAREHVTHVETGTFGADMCIDLANDGPFTIYLETEREVDDVIKK